MMDANFGGKPEEKNRKTKKWAYFLIIAAASLWGTIGIFIKKLSGLGFAPQQIVFIRAIGASMILVLFTCIKNPKLFKIKPRHFIYFIGTGIFSFVFFNWCYFIAINKTSLSVAAILLYTAPAWVTVFSAILFKEELTPRKITSLVLTFAGCILVTAFIRGAGNAITVTGVLAGLGAGLGYALYSIFGRYALKKYDSLTVTLYTFLFASMGLLPAADVKGLIFLFSNADAVYYAVTLSLFATVFPFLLYTKGLVHLETSKASIIATLEPIVATVVGILFYGEPVTVFKTAGIAIVIFAVSILRQKSGSIQTNLN